MDQIAHRGCAARYPENTVHAVTASSFHLDTVEIDIRRCGTGELVVFHDERVDRATNGTGAVADLTLSDLRQLDVEGSGHSVPTLDELVRAVDAFPWPISLQVELKKRGLFKDARTALEPLEDCVRYTSFDRGCVQSFMAEQPGAPYRHGLLVKEDPVESIPVANDLDCDTYHPSISACVETNVVARAREHGLTVISWGGTTREDVRRAAGAGVDGVTSDDWQWGRDALEGSL